MKESDDSENKSTKKFDRDKSMGKNLVIFLFHLILVVKNNRNSIGDLV